MKKSKRSEGGPEIPGVPGDLMPSTNGLPSGPTGRYILALRPNSPKTLSKAIF